MSSLNTEIVRSDISHEDGGQDQSFNKVSKIQAFNNSNMNTHINSSSSEENSHSIEDAAAQAIFHEEEAAASLNNQKVSFNIEPHYMDRDISF